MIFEELVNKIRSKLKGISYKLSSVYSLFSPEDLYQEAILRLWQDFNAGKLADKTDSYILQGCYFHLKNYLRHHKYKINLVSLDGIIRGEKQEEVNLNSLVSIKSTDSVFDTVNTKVIIDEINNNGLTKREKDVFNLALLGLTTREIGGKLGVSHVRVVKLREKIKEKCRRHLDILYPGYQK
ncbi:MAG: sigma-70 family RNA polymerase sigma factor [Candidatus Omnitrophica bacterium]|nr:sigma-70 family RNA polymerase sigma factor [Candidatus Omnitrophota bacterium]